MNAGFVKLHRSITEWEWYSDVNTCRLFLHLLLTANYKPTKFQGHDVPAGGVVTGYPALAAQTGLSVKSVRTAIKHLKSTGEVAVNSTTKFSIITMTNWEAYQQEGSQPALQGAGKGQATGSQGATSKEGKKERKKEVLDARVKTRPSRIPDDWQPDEVFAQREGIGRERTKREADKFRDYWRSQPGQKGVKTDWPATWRNWVRKAAESRQGLSAPDRAPGYMTVAL